MNETHLSSRCTRTPCHTEVIAGTAAGEELGGDFDTDHGRSLHQAINRGSRVSRFKIWREGSGMACVVVMVGVKLGKSPVAEGGLGIMGRNSSADELA